jgi:hypothetical protein
MISVTVGTVTNVKIEKHVEAVLKTANALPFPSKQLIICPNRPNLPSGFRWESDPEFANWTFPKSLNLFLKNRLLDFVDTELMVYVHDDGFAVNPTLWTDEFLAYDYIGAPWPSAWCKDNRVGNGGFSIRSRQLLELNRVLPDPSGMEPEDVHICRTNYDWLMQHKCRFAPVDVALRFSFESVLKEYPRWDCSMSFGFHGKHLLPQVTSR